MEFTSNFFERKYGFVEWVKRYSPMDELLFTVLSQNTTDLNSAKAFQNLINAFGTPEGIARQPVQSIANQIRVAGLGNIKSVRIKKILSEIKRQVGSYDISFLRDAHDELESIIAPENRYQLHVYLINHGRKICKAIKPKCDECILVKKCPSSRSRS